MSLRVNILATLLLGALQSLEVKNLPCGLVQKSTTYTISKKTATIYASQHVVRRYLETLEPTKTTQKIPKVPF